MTSHDFPKSFAFETALGRLSFTSSVVGKGDGSFTTSLTERKPVEALPEGMAVEVRRAVVFSVSSKSPLREIRFECHLDTDLKGELCTGQGLDAQEWESESRVLAIGTEDGEWLGARYPFLGCEGACIVGYGNQSMTIELEDVPLCRNLELHFIVAENPSPEPVEDSASFAVDCAHHLLK